MYGSVDGFVFQGVKVDGVGICGVKPVTSGNRVVGCNDVELAGILDGCCWLGVSGTIVGSVEVVVVSRGTVTVTCCSSSSFS